MNQNFKWQNYSDSGFFIRNEVKQLKTIKDKNGNEFIIAAINDDTPKLYRLNEE